MDVPEEFILGTEEEKTREEKKAAKAHDLREPGERKGRFDDEVFGAMEEAEREKEEEARREAEAEEERRAKRKRRRKRRTKKILFWTFVSIQGLLIALVLIALGIYHFGGYSDRVKELKAEAKSLVSDSNATTFVPSQKVSIYDCDGNLITERKPEVEAEYVYYEDIPAYFVTAMISIEDKRYYSHDGVDYKAVVRALKAYVDNGGSATQGASTITMQLAKIMYMDTSTKTWEYKLEQMFIAQELEKRYSKNKIMEYYLNNIYFSNGYYGIEAAAHGYFNCELNELSLSQIAYLCAIPNSPAYYDPLVYPENTIKRRNLILKNMYEDGQIDEATYQAALSEEIVLNIPQSKNSFDNNYVDTYTYYCATKILMEQEGFVFQYYFETAAQEQEYKTEYEEVYNRCQKKLYTNGYKIYTSFDMDKQEELQEAVNTVLSFDTSTNENGAYDLQGSAVCIDNSTGLVVAMVGGREQNFSVYTLNRAYQSHRQPGSSIKPLLVYTPMFERGYTPDTIVVDEPIEDGPQNAGGGYSGEVTIRYAIAHSLNTIAWKLYEELTPEVGLEYLKNMNFTAIVDDDYYLASSIGGFTNGVSALEMASGYATIENGGLYREPSCIVKIVDADQNIIYEATGEETRIYTAEACDKMTDCLQTVMASGTGQNQQIEGVITAGKTGTTNDLKDGWFVGYSAFYTTAVWVGYDYPKAIEGLGGGTYPGYIWNTYMTAIHEGLPTTALPTYASGGQNESNTNEGNQADSTGTADQEGQDAEAQADQGDDAGGQDGQAGEEADAEPDDGDELD